MTQRKEDGNNAVTYGENSTESKQSLQSEQGRTPTRKNQQQRLIISLVLFTVLAWVLGRCEAGFLWIFLLLVWMLLWWNNNAARIIELAAEEVENDLRRKKAQTNSETAEWLNFLLNRW